MERSLELLVVKSGGHNPQNVKHCFGIVIQAILLEHTRVLQQLFQLCFSLAYPVKLLLHGGIAEPSNLSLQPFRLS